MQIIFGRDNAEKLREKYTILDLEAIDIGDGRTMEVFCLIPAEKLGILDLQHVGDWIKLHDSFLKAYHDKNYEFCQNAKDALYGKFGGEVDTFYDEIFKRIDSIETPST